MGDKLTLLSGVCCLIAAIALAMRHAALSPTKQTWPDGPPVIRAIMFLFMLTLVWRGIHAILGASDPMERTPPEGAYAAVLLAAYHVAMACNVMRQNYPVRVWGALRRIQSLASCTRPNLVPAVVNIGVKGAAVLDGIEIAKTPSELRGEAERAHAQATYDELLRNG